MKPRFGSKNKCLPPSRALLAQIGDRKETATWVRNGHGWKCFNATGALKWMQKMTVPSRARIELANRKINWHWLQPIFAPAITPPFQ